MASRFQYQQWAEPVQFAPSVTPDMWLGHQPTIVPRAKALPAAILAGAFFFLNLGLPENVSADRFHPTYPDKIERKQFHASQQQTLAFVAPEPNNEGKWTVVYPDYISPRPGLHASRQQFFTQPLVEIITEDKWQGWHPDYINRKQLHASQIPYYFWFAHTYVLIYPEAHSLPDKFQATSMQDAIRAKDDT